MGRRVRERDKEKALPPSKRKPKGELVDGQVTTDWNKTLTQFTAAYPNRINLNLTQNTGQAREELTDCLVEVIADLETADWEIPDSLRLIHRTGRRRHPRRSQHLRWML